MATKSESALAAVKAWLFPSLVTILAMMIWRDVTEMRTDIKSLLAQASVDKTKIEQLERNVRSIEMTVYNKKPVASNLQDSPLFSTLLFKHEDFYSIENNIESENL